MEGSAAVQGGEQGDASRCGEVQAARSAFLHIPHRDADMPGRSLKDVLGKAAGFRPEHEGIPFQKPEILNRAKRFCG